MDDDMDGIDIFPEFEDEELNTHGQSITSEKEKIEKEKEELEKIKKQLDEERKKFLKEKKKFEKKKKEKDKEKLKPILKKVRFQMEDLEKKAEEKEIILEKREKKKRDNLIRYSLAITDNIQKELQNSLKRDFLSGINKKDSHRIGVKHKSVTLEKIKLRELREKISKSDRKEMVVFEDEKEKVLTMHEKRKTMKTLRKSDLIEPDEEHEEEEEKKGKKSESELIHERIMAKLNKIKVAKSKREKKKKKKMQKTGADEKKDDDNEPEGEGENEEDEEEEKKSKKRKKLTSKQISRIIKRESLVYLNINSYSKLGEPLYLVLRECMPYPIDKKFSLIGNIKRRKKKGQKSRYFFVIHKNLMVQTFYFNSEKNRYVKKKKGKRIKPEFRAFNLPNIHFIKRTITKKPKRQYVCINLLRDMKQTVKFT